jgi:hypothetical protein
MTTAYKVVEVNADAEKYLLDLHVDERIILKKDLKEMEWVWTGIIFCRKENSGGRALVRTVLNLRVPQNGGKLRERTNDGVLTNSAVWSWFSLYQTDMYQTAFQPTAFSVDSS